MYVFYIYVSTMYLYINKYTHIYMRAYGWDCQIVNLIQKKKKKEKKTTNNGKNHTIIENKRGLKGSP